MPLRVYDQTIAVMRRAVDAAKLGNDERLAAIERLDAEARRVEATAETPGFAEYVADNRARSHEYGGRTVFDDRKPAARPKRKSSGQLDLFTPTTAPALTTPATTTNRSAAPTPTPPPAPRPTAAAPSSTRATRESA